MRFIPLQKWYDIIQHNNRRVQTLMVSRRIIYGINLRILVAMVTELCTHHILQWYEMHTSANFEKSKTHIFSNK